MADGIPIQCGDCGAHYQLDPGGDVQGASCEACGGKRFFRSQPSPTESDMTARDMPDINDPVPGQDTGGNPLAEGNIVGSPGSQGSGIRPGRGAFDPVHTKVAMPRDKYHLDPEWQPELELTRRNPQDIYDQHRGVLEGFERWVPPANTPNADPPGSWQMKFRENASPNPNGTWTPTDEMGTSYIDPASLQGYKLLKGQLPQSPSELQGRFRQLEEGEPPIEGREIMGTHKTAGPNYNPWDLDSTYLHTDVPAGMSLQDYRQQPNRQQMCPICGQAVGTSKDDFYWHMMQLHPDAMAGYGKPTAAKRVETMDTLNMEPYAPLWDESYAKEAGFAAPLLEGAGALATRALPLALPSLMRGVLGQGQGQQAGSEAPEGPTPAPSIEQVSKTKADIPMLLLSAMDTPHSVKSVGEQHDDPEDQDQKEFNVGDRDPSNLKNPNNEDSGKSGEDATIGPGDEFSPDSPSVERAGMILPLLLHYFQSDESGQQDPLIRALHEALEQEKPGYLENEHPDGHKMIELIMQQHKSPHGVHAGVNAFPSGLPAMPGTGFDTPSGSGAQGTCTTCGAPLAADGSCPNCGSTAGSHPQGGVPGQVGGGFSGGPSMPPNAFTGNTQGPVTQEQKDALHQAIESRPELFGDVLNQIQKQPNSPPLVDPSQAQPTPAPMGGMGGPGMPGAPGSMPVTDPTQMGGGGGMPMQPMSKAASGSGDTVRMRCPFCGSGSTTPRPGSSEETTTFECHSCGKLIEDAGKNLDLNKYKGASLNRESLVDVVNPSLENAAERTDVHPEGGHDPSLTWTDAHGQPIELGQTYELHTAGMPTPDEVKVVSKKPDELGLKMVGVFSNIATDPGMSDFTIRPQDIRSGKYALSPSGPANDTPEQPLGGMPGLEQIPQSGPTTDEQSNSYPNDGTLSHVSAEDYEDLCHRCGSDHISHIASSETTVMHECWRCGTAWETKDEDYGHTASTDLAWLYEGSQDDFWGGMERAAKMREGSGQSRSLQAALEKDNRYQQVKDILNRNDQSREAKLAGRHFTPSEQRELINERGTARNADLMDLSNTHYTTIMGYDPRDPRGQANEMNAPDGHLVFGL